MLSPGHAAPVLAILGPTNTGKTHYAIERMMARGSGVIGLPLRLLAREVYDKVRASKGDALCALITGEEKIEPPKAQYYICTVEAMPTTRTFDFVAVDEIQLMGHPERGHIFTDRALHMRGRYETLLLGASTIRPVLRDLLPNVRFDTRERFSTLSYAGEKKLTRLPKRSVIVAFSADEVYGIAELLRRYRGGAAIVMGALSPRTRNAQADLFQSGEVDFLVATDAVGMGLNLDTDHVAFAALTKFDGRRRRYLTPMEAGQIAGRAGRFRNHGTFGTTGNCAPFEPDMIARIENHMFEDMRYAEWRNADLNFQSVDALRDSLAVSTPSRRLRRIAYTTDEAALDGLLVDKNIASRIQDASDVQLLWEVCQVPDFRNLAIDSHIRLLSALFLHLKDNAGVLSDDFLNQRIARLNHTDGSVDTLSTRLAHIRTWTYCANKVKWMRDAPYWINHTRDIEDRLSDALHEALTARFIDRRTNALLKGMTKAGIMTTTIRDDGEVWLDDHKIGRLTGLKFEVDVSQSELEAKALMTSAKENIGPEVNRRLTSLSAAQQAVFTLSARGEILWGGMPVGQIAPGGTVFNPDVTLIGGEFGDPNLCQLAESRMREFLKGEVMSKLECLGKLKALSDGSIENSSAAARGFAFQMLEHDGHLDRRTHFNLVRNLENEARRELREIGAVFGQYDVYLRDLVKPKPAELLSLLVSFGAGGDKNPFIPFAGMTSIAMDDDIEAKNLTDAAIFRAGYRKCGPRIVRFDILNRLAALIRQAQSESGSRDFQIMQEMLALLGCTYEDMQGVLQALGYKAETREPKPNAATKLDKEDKTGASQADTDTDTHKTDNDNSEQSIAGQTDETVDMSSGDVASENSEAESNINADEPSQSDQSQVKDTQTSKEPVKLQVYEQRSTADDGTVSVVPNTEFWSMPQKSRGNFKGKGRSHGGHAKGKKGGKGGSYNRNMEKGPRHSAKSQKPIDKDSPFAVLAALKSDNKTSKSDENS